MGSFSWTRAEHVTNPGPKGPRLKRELTTGQLS